MPRTLDRELGTLKERIQPTSFDMVCLMKCKTLKHGGSKPDHLGFICILPPPPKLLIDTQLLTGGGFVWTDWGWGGVSQSASDALVTGAGRSVRELKENNGTETTPNAGEEEVTTTEAIEQGEMLVERI